MNTCHANQLIIYSLRITSQGLTATWVSDNVTEILGYSVDEALETNWWLRNVHPEDKAQAIAAHLDLSEIKQLAYQYRFRRKDGSWTWLRDERRMVGEAGHKLVEIAGCWSDLSGRKHTAPEGECIPLENQPLRSQRLESIGALTGGIAHDLNNLFAPILLASHVLESRLHDPQDKELLSRIQASVQRGSEVVRQVLGFARGIESKRVLLPPRCLIGEVVKIIQETFPKTVSLKVEVPDDLWNITANATQLEQVLLNLCLNARDAMPNGGTLAISAANLTIDALVSGLSPDAMPGPYVVLQVEDSGSGIPPALLEKIFEPFFSTKDATKGTGLGLSTTLEIIRSHHGFVQVSSEPGKGSIFRVGLPATRQPIAPTHDHPAAPLRNGNGQSVLVVDDERNIRQLIQAILGMHGYQVLVASDGAEALELFRQHAGTIHLVVTDLMMPRMEGLALIQALRKLDPEVKIIASSGSVGSTDNTRVSGTGGTASVDASLPKPFTAEVLLETVARVLQDRLPVAGG